SLREKQLQETFLSVIPFGQPGYANFDYTFHPFSFYQHEVHALTGIYRDDWTPKTHAFFNAGWLYDRINDSDGPLIGGSIDHDLTARTQVGVRGQYSHITTEGGSGDGIDLGADVKYKF
ncbi:MAG: hypothetical protein B7X02_03210, partial [Rhodospirillales bacterium 12-54-5]